MFRSRSLAAWLLIAALVCFTAQVIQRAWMAEDAYITLRTVHNFVHGHGLRWNIGERVQSYTHPLWMFVLSLGYAITREAFYTSIALSVGISVAAMGVIAFRVALSPGHGLVAILLLSLSPSVLDFSTGGFENALAHLLLALFAWQFLVARGNCARLCFIAALLAVNRLDLVLLPLPALVAVIWQRIRESGYRSAAREAALGFSPLLAWEAFSLLYYGFPFPNTAYVKLGHGVAASELIKQGLVYLLQSIGWDPIVGVLLALGIAAGVTARRARPLLLALGALLYVVYVVRIGGDFMKGRFLTSPAVVAACVLARAEWPLHQLRFAAACLLPAVFLKVAPGNTAPWPEPTLRDPYQPGIVDERLYSRQGWIEEGRRLKRSGRTSYVVGHVGMVGFFAGPMVHIIDYHALTDALIARLPPLRNTRWLPGHFRRVIPPGYVETGTSSECRMSDVELCQYYQHLRLILSGPLFSFERLKTIAKMNLGAYDGLIDRERYHLHELVRRPLASVASFVPDGAAVDSPGVLRISEAGLEVLLDAPSSASALELSLDPNDDYRLSFFRGGERLGAPVRVDARYGKGMVALSLETPPAARERGFDRVRIQPTRGDGRYYVGHVRPAALP